MVSVTDLEERDELLVEESVRDDTETDDIEDAVNYRITSYGVDYDMEGLVRRISRGSIFVPDFQRGFVWSQKQASQFIESLLLGLPVPGIFLTTHLETEKLMVIDGQQRLKTLQFFYSGEFGESGKRFALQGVSPKFEGKRYVDLREPDRERLDNALIHATVTRQLYPEDGMSSVFHIFRRLNSTGQRLVPQEIRHAIYQGSLLDSIRELNENSDWRAIFGPKHRRQKDQELILRFWALYLQSSKYEEPMVRFLNNFAEANLDPDKDFLREGKALFAQIVRLFNSAFGRRAFRTSSSRQLNAAVFDSMSVGLAKRINCSGAPKSNALQSAADNLLRDREYVDSVSGGTAQPRAVQTRIEKATSVFGGL
jgi:uncharacterized protein with ParB-like and HNH nuclease domain